MNIQDSALLERLRSDIFSGTEFTESIIKRYSGQYKGIDISQAIKNAKAQMQPALLPDITFDILVKFHGCRDKINELLPKHQEYLLNTFPETGDEPFNILCSAFEKQNKNIERINQYIKYLEERARKQETKDTGDRLFEQVRTFAQWCKDFLIGDKYASLYPVLSRNYAPIVPKIAAGVSKVGIGIVNYSKLAEESYSLLRNVNEIQGFQYILALINLRCKGLGVPVPSVNATVACPNCGDKDQTGNICSKCGAYIKCPGCGAVIIKNSKGCGGCGVEIDKLKTYVSQIEDAEKKLSGGDIEAVELLVSPVKAKWAKNERVINLVNKIALFRSELSEQEKKLNESISSSKYSAGRKIIEEIKKKTVLTPSLKAKEQQIQQKIEQATAFVQAGDRATDVVRKIDSYAQALQSVSDLDTAISKIKQQSLLITDFKYTVQGTIVNLGWAKIPVSSCSVEYIVYKEDISHKKAKEKVVQTAATSCNDVIEVGISYIYSVQAQFRVSGVDISVLSQGEVKSQEIIAVGEAVVTKSIGGDHLVSIEFTVPKNVLEIRVVRIEKGVTKKISGNYKSGKFSDNGVVNDTACSYKIISCFQSQSRGIIESKGVEVSVTPTAPPLPVKLNKREGDNYTEIIWANPPKGSVILYLCDEKLNFVEGELIDISTVKGSAINSSGTSAKIPHTFHGIKYLYPVTKINNSCVIGAPAVVESMQKIRNASIEKTDERRIEITWLWDNLEEVAVFTKVGNNAENKQIISKRNTMYPKHAITIPREAKNITVGIASYCKSSSGKELFSERTEKLFSLQIVKIDFKEVSGGGLFSKNKYKLTIQANAPIPCDLHLLIGEGRTPMDLNNYKSYLTIPQKGFEADKSCSYSLEYTRKDKSKPLIFRLNPADEINRKNIVITPETKLLK
ncbi:MAG: zinc ribbon domain-containing protein [Prevotellaceae bacterium]|jgi:hypothetical protein|nr:zinc ribbon domain-containing protein [Prevotellaceae bacterium]